MSSAQLKQRCQDDYGFHLEYRTRWSDNDMYDHMNNSVYSFLFDSIINSYLIEHCGLHPPTSTQIGVVIHSTAEFFASVAFPSIVHLGLRVNKLGKSSVTYEVGVFEHEKEDVRAVGEYTHVFIERKTNRPATSGIDTLDEQARSTKMAKSQSGPSAVLAGPEASQSDNNSVSTQLLFKKDELRKPPTFGIVFASRRIVLEFTANEPLTRKRQRQEAAAISFARQRSQPEQRIDAVHQQSEETIQCLREEIRRLRRENSDQQARQLALIKGFVTSAAVVEGAVDVRGAEQQVFLNNDQLKTMRFEYEIAQHSHAMTAIFEEKLSFMMGLSGQ
ncbi:MAG: hypothetical protein ASARMPRED_004707 [Alectoria sarmentosa]|nr:MAG: hypothetical protein ASARMPRED_004707 [Alectoria sarmentosa]